MIAALLSSLHHTSSELLSFSFSPLSVLPLSSYVLSSKKEEGEKEKEREEEKGGLPFDIEGHPDAQVRFVLFYISEIFVYFICFYLFIIF